jgi:hypothetical protein
MGAHEQGSRYVETYRSETAWRITEINRETGDWVNILHMGDRSYAEYYEKTTGTCHLEAVEPKF